MNNKWSNIFLGSIFVFNSAGVAANLLINTDLLGHSAIAGAALTIAADANVTSDLAALGALNIGARSVTQNIYAGMATSIEAGSITGNIYAGMAINVEADSKTGNIYAVQAAVIGNKSTVGDIYSAAAVTLNGSSSAQNIYSGASVSLVGVGSSAKDVYAVGAISGAGSSTSNSPGYVPGTEIDEEKAKGDNSVALAQIKSAKLAYNDAYKDLKTNIDQVTTLAAGGSYILTPGVYVGTALTIGEGATIIFDGDGQKNPFWLFNLSTTVTTGKDNIFAVENAGKGAAVLWNLGGGLSLGAGTAFIGTVLATEATTGGAGSYVSCGNLFSLADVTIGSVKSSDCLGAMINQVVPVSAPTPIAIFALGLIGLGLKRRRQR
ncbi:MAG: hypothetical protein ACJA13_002076 [Paraglaciecola sp.]|jgi:hypothetical protein